jgi:hypothetical protein
VCACVRVCMCVYVCEMQHIIAAVRSLSAMLPAAVGPRLQDALPSLMESVPAAGATAREEGGGWGGEGGGQADWVERLVSIVATCLEGSPEFATEFGKSLMEQRQVRRWLGLTADTQERSNRALKEPYNI